MTHQIISVALFLISVCMLPSMAQSTLGELKPIILFIPVDDLRPEINCYGATHMNTPNIDRLVCKGMLFEISYCQQAICMASRTSIMNSIRPEYKNLYYCSSILDLVPEVITLNEHLKNQEYSTYSIGKIYHHGEDRSDQFPDNRIDPTDRWVGRGDHGWKLGYHHAWSKHTNFEFNLRVPMIISAPGMETAREFTSTFAESVDVYPILCDLSAIPKIAHLHGENLVPGLKDPEEKIRYDAYSIISRNRTDDQMTITGFSIRTDQFRLVEWIQLALGKILGKELYGHELDSLGNINMAQHPDYRKEVFHLLKVLHCQYDTAIQGMKWPGTTQYDSASLLYSRTQYRQGNSPYTSAVDSLKAAADRLLMIKPFFVMQKKIVPPSRDKHDYPTGSHGKSKI